MKIQRDLDLIKRFKRKLCTSILRCHNFKKYSVTQLK